ncbi:hypothetical protein H6G89_28870 [Oscillatoria sp. FACHB-1407]|uniref:WD40 repeat domain-containing protein n=1 Tax=Oscillatoria sp. FACHB-1407 TaxID=2692847 RepID=UPI0016882243|nr:hypothetical protein [Oscillatoria sp. FACHB-1407]MBD2465023.1 hypothetical protein [Oscillatoria sp. FACHB-1407]
MNLLPYHSFTIQTPDPPEVVRQRLATHIEAPKILRWQFSHHHAPYEGKIWETGFELRRIIHYRNSFLPTVRGRFEVTSQGTDVHITMGMHPVVTAFLAIWGFFWYSALIPLTLAGGMPGEVALLFLGLPTILFVGFWYAFWYEANRAQDDLIGMIAGEVLDGQAWQRRPKQRWLKMMQLGLIGLGLALALGQFVFWQFQPLMFPEASSLFTPCTQNPAQSPYCTFSVVHRLAHPTATTLTLSTDGQTLVSGGQDKAIRVWDVETGQLIKTLQSDSGQVRAVAIAPDGKTVVSGSTDRRVRIWSLTTDQRPLMLAGHTEGVEFIRISPDGKTITSASQSEIKRWNLATGELEATLPTLPSSELQLGPITISNGPDRFIIRDISADGRTAIFEFFSGKVVLWDLIADQLRSELNERFDAFSGYVLSAHISPDGTLAAIQYSNSSAKFETQLKVWDLTAGEVKARGQVTASDTTFIDVPMAVTGDRILGSTNTGLNVWNLQTAEPEASLDVEWMSALTVSADGTFIAGITGDASTQNAKIQVLHRG